MAILTVNDDVTIPGVVVCVHVETITETEKLNPNRRKHVLRCWSAVAGRIEGDKWTREKQKQSTLSHDFWEWLNYVRLPQRPVWLFQCDLPRSLTALGLWCMMERADWTLHRRPDASLVNFRRRRGDKQPDKATPGVLITSGPPDAVVMYHKAGWKVIALGVENFLRDLHALKQSVQIETLPTAPSTTAPIANWYDYCGKQSHLVASAVTDLIVWHKKQELGRFPFSIAGMALAGFRHRFMAHDIHLPDDQDERDLQREAYYGGRVETFWCGEVNENTYTPLVKGTGTGQLAFDTPRAPFFYLDARSFYGAIGASCDLPCECIESSPVEFDGEPPASGRMVEYLAGVEIATQDDVYPVRVAGKVHYARGHYRTVLAGPELSRAFQRGHVMRWLWWRRFRLEPIFKAYCTALYAERQRLRKENLTVAESAVKSLLARLHGKFLQRANRWEARPKMRAPDAWARWMEHSATTGITRTFRAVGWDVEEEVDAGDAPHCFPAIAAWVTSWGREWVNTWINYAGSENVYYCCTDGLIVNETGKRRLEDRGIIWPDVAGALRVQDCQRRIRIIHPNNFQFGPRRVRSGRADNYREDQDGLGTVTHTDSLKSILYARHGAGCYEHDQPWRDAEPRITQDITDNGWLIPPQVNTCQPDSLPRALASSNLNKSSLIQSDLSAATT